jgi:hypothetical protein
LPDKVRRAEGKGKELAEIIPSVSLTLDTSLFEREDAHGTTEVVNEMR